MTVLNKDVTLVLQGPTVSLSGRLGAAFKNINNYQKYVSKIIVSTWSHHNVKPSSSMLKKHNIGYIEDNIEQYTDYYNDANIAYQCISSLNGMDLVDTKYVIKARCDEKYTDLSKFIEVMKASPDKLTTNNFLFVNDDWLQFHPSDHVMGGTTDNMKGMFETATATCQKNGKKSRLTGKDMGIADYRNGMLDNSLIPPETLLLLSFLKHKNVSIDCSKSIDIMKEHCELVELKDMGKFLCHLACVPYTNYDVVLNKTPSITSLEEL
tara:strand:+ start:229 stop:1026 length:798 start_codon:yes stop_codon:yes gene_type:complete